MKKNTHSIDTIEQAIRILAYNDYFWEDFKVHPMDRKTVISLADAPYAWTEKQGKLALALLKRYHTLYQKFDIDLSSLLKNPVYKDTFRVIDFNKSVKQYQDENGQELIEIKFPYNEKIISLLRVLKNKKANNLVPMAYDGESKKWTVSYTELTCYYITLIAIRYNFKIITPHILENFEEVKKEKLNYKPPVVKLKDKKIIIDHANENLTEWWNNNYKNKTLLHQFDILKNLSITSVIPSTITEKSTLAEKIATSMNTNLWIDRSQYSKIQFLQALQELELFPAMVPIGGLIETFEEIKEFEAWYHAFKELGFTNSQIVWGVNLEEAPPITDNKEYSYRTGNIYPGNSDYVYGKETSIVDRELMNDRWNDLVLESKVSKHIDTNTKIIIMRNKIPRTFIKSKIQLRCGFVLQDTGYWPSRTETLSKMVDNLPKRLYYVSRKPGFLETNIVQI